MLSHAAAVTTKRTAPPPPRTPDPRVAERIALMRQTDAFAISLGI